MAIIIEKQSKIIQLESDLYIRCCFCHLADIGPVGAIPPKYIKSSFFCDGECYFARRYYKIEFDC